MKLDIQFEMKQAVLKEVEKASCSKKIAWHQHSFKYVADYFKRTYYYNGEKQRFFSELESKRHGSLLP